MSSKNKKDNLGDRMKDYEKVSNYRLIPKTPVILRVDGKAFHTFTRGLTKPFDWKLIEAMVSTAEETTKGMMGFVLGYCQSDECTFYINNTQKLESQAWFNNELQKLTSVTASMFTANFNRIFGSEKAFFDCRAFNVPEDEVGNVFVWRQQDWQRNSLQMFAVSHFSHKELHGKNKTDMNNMLYSVGKDWSELDPILKNGTFITNKEERISSKMNYFEISELISYLEEKEN